MSEHRFVVFDRLSRNQLGEYPTLDEAEACLVRFVRAEASAAEHLEIWDDETGDILAVDPDKLRSVTAA